jgi:hypothetical protein
MSLLFGTPIAAGLWLIILTMGYGLAGFIPSVDRLTRLTVASLVGLAWVILGVSVVGAIVPLSGATVWLIWAPTLLTLLIPTTRMQLWTDICSLSKSSQFFAAITGLALLWITLLLPCIVYPDLVFFDGKTNHDNFFWCVAAEYLQQHTYLSAHAQNRDHPLFNLVGSIIGWKPSWGRMGAEGFLALMSSTVLQSPVQLYNFMVSSLALPWVLTVIAIARRMGLPPLNFWPMVIVCFCQPVLFFFIANGNLPNLFGAIFAGGLWLVMLLISASPPRILPFAAAGALLTHGLLCSYPEIVPFAFVPITLLVAWHLFHASTNRTRPFILLVVIVLAGFCLNPLTTARAWNGFWSSIVQVRKDAIWANVFAPLTFAGYVPSLITLAMPSVKLYGIIGGVAASLGVLTSFVLLIKRTSQRALLLISLSGFFAMLVYTLVNSFGYGWQKSVQFFGIPLAVLFPALLVNLVWGEFFSGHSRKLVQVAVLATLSVMLHGMIGTAAENLKSAGNKGLTRQLLSLRDRMTHEYPGQPLYIDGATFRASFFHSMWSARLFAGNPLVFLSRQDQAGGYLRDSIALDNPTALAPTGFYYVAANWAKAFDYEPPSLFEDRVGSLIKNHNLVTEFTGFYRPSGVPQMTADNFSITLFPYADGWLEFTLEPNGTPSGDCHVRGSASTDSGVESIETIMDVSRHLVVRFPLKAGTRNILTARISGAPPVDLDGDDPPYPFQILNVRSTRTPTP